MSGDDQNSPAAIARGEVMLEALIAKPVSRVLSRVSAHVAEFAELPAKVAVNPAQNALPIRGREIGVREFEIAKPGTPQPRQQAPRRRSEGRTYMPRDIARQRSDEAQQRPDKRIFQTFSHRERRNASLYGRFAAEYPERARAAHRLRPPVLAHS